MVRQIPEVEVLGILDVLRLTKANEIANLRLDSRKPTYEAIQDVAREPEQVPIEIKFDEQVDSVDPDRNPLPIEKKHLLSTLAGDYPLEQKMGENRWERATMKQE